MNLQRTTSTLISQDGSFFAGRVWNLNINLIFSNRISGILFESNQTVPRQQAHNPSGESVAVVVRKK